MTTSRRSKIFLTLFSALGLAAASAATAFAAAGTTVYTPRLIVSSGGIQSPSETRFTIYNPHGSAATAEADLYVGAAYRPTLTQSVGTQIGAVSGALEDRGATAPFTTGTVTVADPSAYANASCDSSRHDAVWLATLRSSAATLSFPIFVRTLAGQPTELHWCLTRSDPSLATLAFDLDGVFQAPTRGSSLWDARFTPYDVETGAEIASEQVSSLVGVKLPQLVSLRVAYSQRSHAYRVTGKASQDGQGARGYVRLFRSIDSGPFTTNRAIGGLAKLAPNGSFSYTGRLATTKPVHFRAHFVASPVINKNCGKDINGVRCVNAATSGWETDSNVATVRP